VPVPQQRDRDVTQRRLAAWLTDRLPGTADPRVQVELPERSGFSHETLLVDAVWPTAGGPHRERLVVRVASPTYQVMPVSRLHEEYQVLRALAATDVPVPVVYGYEPDPQVLGAPFYVMSREDGWVPPDLPSYHREGPVVALDEGSREALWWSGVDILHRVHRLDPRRLGLRSLASSATAPVALADQLDFYEEHLGYFGCADSPQVRDALRLLRGALPPQPADPGLLWGDARLGNIVFRGVRAAAVLDWEMVSLGPGEADLAWYLYLDRHLSEGIGAKRLTGLPDRAATVARYEELTGRSVAPHLGWYEVFAGLRFAVITARVGRLLVEHSIVACEDDVPLARNAARLLSRTLAAVAG
jgi:aminoglycoside phosphotransferase (APT) family kinase protein